MNAVRALLSVPQSSPRRDRSDSSPTRRRRRRSGIGAETPSSALDALATGLASIGDKFARRRQSFRVL
ncbi:MAG TPA: hypothetical protein VMS99_13195 [Acidimicrobiia bacterium]|nr:hypothetical protein [Acidimicrobiia bacterium]